MSLTIFFAGYETTIKSNEIPGVGMLVFSLRGVNFGFWYRFGCSGENAIICSPYIAVKVSFRVLREEILKKINLVCGKYGLF